MLVEFGKAGLIGKARQQPDKVKAAIDKVKTDGLAATIEAVRHKLDQPVALGYCNVGRVVEAGRGASEFRAGDLVVSNGKHAEIVSVPTNLCAKVPEGVSAEHAAFTVIASIGLQGVRLAEPTLGETVVVTGLGLIGLLTVQLLRANGCRVIGIDYDSSRLELARKYGAETIDLSAGEDPVAGAVAYSRGRGVDAVIIAAATDSTDPVRQAAQMCRKRGRIVLVGVCGLELSRADFYEKELSFQVSCSYGPGRYDPSYEEAGVDYPIGFVRWTEQRNFEAVLDLLDTGRLVVDDLLGHRFDISEAAAAYKLMTDSPESLGILLDYPDSESVKTVSTRTVELDTSFGVSNDSGRTPSQPNIGFIGAGNYGMGVLMPAFLSAGCKLSSVASANGVSGINAARKFGIASTTTDAEELINQKDVHAVVVATRHDTHADLASMALTAGKHVFVEKPLALTIPDIDRIASIIGEHNSIESPRSLMVGFNRRFSPQIQTIRRAIESNAEPVSMVLTMNAGKIPADHWAQDPVVGGGRIVGEACHYIDLARFLAGSPVRSWDVSFADYKTRDTASISLKFENGSIAAVHYFANGNKSLPKERIEVFGSGKVLQLNNFRELRSYGWKGVSRQKLWRQDKGQNACVQAFVESLATGEACIPLDEILEVSRLTLEIAEAN